MMSDSWKRFENYVCRMFGGHRRGPDYSDDGGEGKNDCVDTPGWSIEIRLRGRFGWQMLVDQCCVAENRRSSPNDIPLFIFKKKGARKENTLVAMRLTTFLDHFGGNDASDLSDC